MSNLRQPFSIFLVLTLLVSVVLFATASAADYPTPSVPEFTISITDSSYDTPSTSLINGFTGETTTMEGEHVEMRTVTFKIKNQDNFTPYTIQNNSNTYTINYLYNLRWKGQYEDDWHTCFIPEYGIPSMDYESDYTILSYNCGYSDTDGLSFTGSHYSYTFPVGAEVDFQVQAMIGYTHFKYVDGGPWGTYVFEGKESGWSSTQTITIEGTTQTPTANSPSEQPTTTSNSSASENLSLWSLDLAEIAIVGLLAVIAVLLIFVVYYLRKKSTK